MAEPTGFEYLSTGQVTSAWFAAERKVGKLISRIMNDEPLTAEHIDLLDKVRVFLFLIDDDPVMQERGKSVMEAFIPDSDVKVRQTINGLSKPYIAKVLDLHAGKVLTRREAREALGLPAEGVDAPYAVRDGGGS